MVRQCKSNLVSSDAFMSILQQLHFPVHILYVWTEGFERNMQILLVCRFLRNQSLSGDLVGKYCALTRDFACLQFRIDWYMLGDLGRNSHLCDCCNYIQRTYQKVLKNLCLRWLLCVIHGSDEKYIYNKTSCLQTEQISEIYMLRWHLQMYKVT